MASSVDLVMARGFGLLLLCLLVFSGCRQEPSVSRNPVAQGPPGGQPSTPPDDAQSRTFSFTGVVVYSDVEGGCFAIRAADGQSYTPIGLPDEVAVDGTRVRVVARLRPDRMSICMAGPLIEIVEIERF
ncbi:MAG: hypothetical protein AB1640_24005 [bacterium]